MRYTTEEALSEIMRRRSSIVMHRNQRECRILSAAVCVLSVVLVSVIAVLQAGAEKASPVSLYGSFLLSQEAGGYVLTALAAFVLGVFVTLLCQKCRKNKKGPVEP